MSFKALHGGLRAYERPISVTHRCKIASTKELVFSELYILSTLPARLCTT
jgi:hypothetical protein